MSAIQEAWKQSPATPPPPQRVLLKDVQMAWGTMFWLIFQAGVCAVPVLWIIQLALRLPSLLWDVLVYAQSQAR